MRYKSNNHMADMGDKIRKYIQDIVSATIADKQRTAENLANISEASRAKDAQTDSITAQIKHLTNTVALLPKSLANKENNGSGGNVGGGKAAEEMAEKAGVLGANKHGYPPETWVIITGLADIT
jgi:hypothetical protein